MLDHMSPARRCRFSGSLCKGATKKQLVALRRTCQLCTETVGFRDMHYCCAPLVELNNGQMSLPGRFWRAGVWTHSHRAETRPSWSRLGQR